MSDPLLTLPESNLVVYGFGEDNELQIGIGSTSIFTWPRCCSTPETGSAPPFGTHRLAITGGGVDVRIPIATATESAQLVALLAKLQEGQ